MKVEPLLYGDRKVYTVAGFNRGVADWLARLPTLWIEGEVTELRRHERWGSVFFTLKDPTDGACLAASMPRRTFDALRLDLADGEHVQVFGRPELYAAKAEFRLRVLSIERFGLGAHLAAIEQLKQTLAADGLFDVPEESAAAVSAADRPRHRQRCGGEAGRADDDPGPLPARTGARRRDARPGPARGAGIVDALQALERERGVDVIVLARGGGSFEDLLPFSDERVVRAVASCGVPVVSAVGHEQDTPLCDLAADVRASTPTAAGKLVVPDPELRRELVRAHGSLERGVRRSLDRERDVCGAHAALERGTRRALERDARRVTSLVTGSDGGLHSCSSAAGTPSSGRRPALGAVAARDARARLRHRPCGRPRAPLQRLGRRGAARRHRAGGGRLGRPRRGDRVSELTFEEAQRELESIVERLERGETSLDEAIALWERGEELYRALPHAARHRAGQDRGARTPGGDGGALPRSEASA